MSISKVPVPFFDTLSEMPNPYKRPVTSVKHLLKDEPASAIDDYQHASEFLYSYRGSPDTFSTYRREIEHFMHWSWLIAGKSLKENRREDIEAYVEFAHKPPKNWLGEKNVARFIEKQGARVLNPEWRPYVLSKPDHPYIMSQSAVQAIFGVLSSF